MILKDVRIGNQRLILGDCLQVMPTLGRFQACLTDPPYGIYLKGGKWGKKFGLEWDRETPDIRGIFEASDRHIVWGGNYFPLPPSRGWLVWHKRDAVRTMADCELAWTSFDANARLFDWTIAATNAERVGHPTQKPVALMEWCLGFLPDAKTILDPFMGSGTTLVACQRMGRHGTGIELDPDYFDIACRRVDEAARQPDLFISPKPEAPKQEQLL